MCRTRRIIRLTWLYCLNTLAVFLLVATQTDAHKASDGIDTFLVFFSAYGLRLGTLVRIWKENRYIYMLYMFPFWWRHLTRKAISKKWLLNTSSKCEWRKHDSEINYWPVKGCKRLRDHMLTELFKYCTFLCDWGTSTICYFKLVHHYILEALWLFYSNMLFKNTSYRLLHQITQCMRV